jgi:hypothetical protein
METLAANINTSRIKKYRNSVNADLKEMRVVNIVQKIRQVKTERETT